MQSPWTNFGSRMGYTEELSDFQRGTVIGYHHSNKSVHQISALQELPRSTVSAVIVKWKRLRAPTAQPRSSRSHKLREWDRRVWKRVAQKKLCRRLQHSIPSSKLTLEATSAQALFVESFMKCVTMAKQLHTSRRSPCTMPNVGWSGVKLTAIGL